MVIDIITNASIPICVIIAEVFYYYRFSGSPFFSEAYLKKASKIFSIKNRTFKESGLFLGIITNYLTGFKYIGNIIFSIFIFLISFRKRSIIL
jgi:hypothetical protein